MGRIPLWYGGDIGSIPVLGSYLSSVKALKVIQEVLSPGADLKFAPIFQRLGNWFRNPEMQIRVLLGALK